MNSLKKIYLTGYMGSGKSLVAQYLSEAINYKIVDTDDCIVGNQGQTISDIFKIHGEKYFRELEWAEIQKLTTKKDDLVVSLGGGAYCQENIQQAINEDKSAFTVYLKYDTKVLVERLENEKNHRPIISEQKDLFHFISKHLEERESYYLKADLIITNESRIEKIIDQILSYRSYLNQKLSTI